VNLIGAPLPTAAPWPLPPRALHEIRIDHPAVESHPNFLARIDPRDLVPAARHYNPSICRFDGRTLMAYRAEGYTAVSRVAVAEFDDEYRVTGNTFVDLPTYPGDAHWEDPHLCVADGRLYVLALYIRLRMPPVCRPRLFRLDARAQVDEEIPVPFGRMGGIEKNWTPFELQHGGVGIVYQQAPRVVLEVATSAGHTSPGVPIAPKGASLSGRAGPVRWQGGYLEFVGGWVNIGAPRVGRYWFGAQMVEGAPPYRVLAYTPKPLAWGSEASPTIHSPRPGAGHPCCVFPGGAVIEGDDAIVSLGVNDSYCALMRFNVRELIAGMAPA